MLIDFKVTKCWQNKSKKGKKRKRERERERERDESEKGREKKEETQLLKRKESKHDILFFGRVKICHLLSRVFICN